jgi:ankyrin repeat protein
VSRPSGATLLHVAAELGQLDLAQALLRAGADPNALNDADEPPLLQLSLLSGVELAKVLIRHGADPAYVEPDLLFTPLGHAIASRSATLALYLIALQVPIDEVIHDITERTPLIAALEQGLLDVAAALLDRGVSVAGADEDGRTALHYAAITGDATICRRLRDIGCPTTTRDRDGKTAADHARERAQVAQGVLAVLGPV